MDIKYLTVLYDNPTNKTADSDYVKKLQPIPLEGIISLENTYNNGNPFPVALRELLYLAGNYCYVLDYGYNDTQEEMQEDARSWLLNRNRSITRPFFVIDVYNGGGQFLFVYLDEDQNDPVIYEAFLSRRASQTEWINPLAPPQLSKFINMKMSMFLSGYNPM